MFLECFAVNQLPLERDLAPGSSRTVREPQTANLLLT